MIISPARIADSGRLSRVMFDAIREGAHLYSFAERRAWIPKPQPRRDFAKIIRCQDVWVARATQGPVGFIALRSDGYINLVFILKHARGKGVFGRLFERIDSRATKVHASLHAEPVFESVGFEVVHREAVARHGRLLRRAYMERR